MRSEYELERLIAEAKSRFWANEVRPVQEFDYQEYYDISQVLIDVAKDWGISFAAYAPQLIFICGNISPRDLRFRDDMLMFSMESLTDLYDHIAIRWLGAYIAKTDIAVEDESERRHYLTMENHRNWIAAGGHLPLST